MILPLVLGRTVHFTELALSPQAIHMAEFPCFHADLPGFGFCFFWCVAPFFFARMGEIVFGLF